MLYIFATFNVTIYYYNETAASQQQCVWRISAGNDEVAHRLKAGEILLCLNDVLEIDSALLVCLIQTLPENEASSRLVHGRRSVCLKRTSATIRKCRLFNYSMLRFMISSQNRHVIHQSERKEIRVWDQFNMISELFKQAHWCHAGNKRKLLAYTHTHTDFCNAVVNVMQELHKESDKWCYWGVANGIESPVNF